MLAEFRDWSLMWREVWSPLLRDPSAEDFQVLVRSPEASMQKALRSMTAAIFISAISWAIVLVFFGMLILFNVNADPQTYLLGLLGLVVFIAIYVVLTLLSILINAGVLHLAAIYIFKGEGTFEELLYGMSLYITPITLLNAGLLFIPVIGWTISFLLGIYLIILQVLALRGVYSFEWIQAIIVATVPYALNQMIIYGLYFVFIFTFLTTVAFI